MPLIWKKEEDYPSCPHCMSDEIAKCGKRKRKRETLQVYSCGTCEARFTEKKFSNTHYPDHIILEAINCRRYGWSYSVITRHLKKHHKLECEAELILRWLRRFADYEDIEAQHRRRRKKLNHVTESLSHHQLMILPVDIVADAAQERNQS